MGDPRKIRKKYETPTHPWQKDRIDEEKVLINEYGLKNKEEIWRMATMLKKFKDQVKALASRFDEQSKLEEEQLVNRLLSLGLMAQGAPLDSILGLGVKDMLERRLQTILVRKGLARSMKQARQFTTHGHILVSSKKVTFPSYIVSLKEEALIEFVPVSSLSKIDHPERMIKEVSKDKTDKKKIKKKEEAPPTFAPEEIVQIEEKGVIEKSQSSESSGKLEAMPQTKVEVKTEVKEEPKKEDKSESKPEVKKADKADKVEDKKEIKEKPAVKGAEEKK